MRKICLSTSLIFELVLLIMTRMSGSQDQYILGKFEYGGLEVPYHPFIVIKESLAKTAEANAILELPCRKRSILSRTLSGPVPASQCFFRPMDSPRGHTTSFPFRTDARLGIAKTNDAQAHYANPEKKEGQSTKLELRLRSDIRNGKLV